MGDMGVPRIREVYEIENSDIRKLDLIVRIFTVYQFGMEFTQFDISYCALI